MKRAVVVAFFFFANAARAQSAADIASARDFFREGMELRAQGKLAEALAKLKAAHALYATPPSALELARAEVDSGLLAEGLETLASIDHIPSAKDSERSKLARAEAKELVDKVRARIPSLQVNVTGDTNAIVTLDGAVVADSLFGVARKIDPGHHVVAARNAIGQENRVDVDVPEGRVTVASIEAPAAVQMLGAFGGGASGGLVGPPRDDRFSVLYKFLPPATNERWSLHGKDGKSLCALPCEKWIGEHSGDYLVRAPTADDDEPRRVDVSSTLPANIGSTVTARPHAGKGSPTVGGIGGALAALGVLGVIGGPITLIVGLTDNLGGPSNTGRDTAIVGGVMTGTSLAFLIAGVLLASNNQAPRIDYSVSP